MKDNRYKVNEIFYSIQGEGLRFGTPNVFVRFSGCNLKCSIQNHAGFDCDTEFSSGVFMTKEEIVERVCELFPNDFRPEVILTGGEPALQVDEPLLKALKEKNCFIAIETNGTVFLPAMFDWITVSPKSAEHTLRVPNCHELKYVRHVNQGIPKPQVACKNLLISPAFEPDGSLKQETLDYCMRLVKDNPEWRLSLQFHKFFNIR